MRTEPHRTNAVPASKLAPRADIPGNPCVLKMRFLLSKIDQKRQSPNPIRSCRARRRDGGALVQFSGTVAPGDLVVRCHLARASFETGSVLSTVAPVEKRIKNKLEQHRMTKGKSLVRFIHFHYTIRRMNWISYQNFRLNIILVRAYHSCIPVVYLSCSCVFDQITKAYEATYGVVVPFYYVSARFWL